MSREERSLPRSRDVIFKSAGGELVTQPVLEVTGLGNRRRGALVELVAAANSRRGYGSTRLPANAAETTGRGGVYCYCGRMKTRTLLGARLHWLRRPEPPAAGPWTALR